MIDGEMQEDCKFLNGEGGWLEFNEELRYTPSKNNELQDVQHPGVRCLA